MDPVFNETVQIVEFDEGFDSEVFFMYVFLVAGLFLVLFLVYSLIGGSKGKKNVAVSKAMETGTTNDDVDYEWIPRSGNLIYFFRQIKSYYSTNFPVGNRKTGKQERWFL